MSTLLEIETAICRLPPSDFLKLADWIKSLKQDGWDARMDRDAATGRLDFLFDEAQSARDAGENRPWPAQS